MRLLTKASCNISSMHSASPFPSPSFLIHSPLPTDPRRIPTNPSPKFSSFTDEASQRLHHSIDHALHLCANTKSLSPVRQLHALILKSPDPPAAGKLISLYGKCGSLENAHKVFDEMPERTDFAWNAMVGAYVSNNDSASSLSLYRKMRSHGVPLHLYTFPLLLKACGKLRELQIGTELHSLAVKLRYVSSHLILNALVSMYAKNNDLTSARRLFDRTQEKGDVVLWNSIMSSYSTSGLSSETFKMFRDMQKLKGLVPNSYSIVSALTSCQGLSYHKLGREIHAYVLKSLYSFDVCVYVCNALIAMYMRCGKTLEARRVFDQMDKHDVVTWNSLIKGYVDNLMYREAVELFRYMTYEPDEVSMSSVIAASGRLGEVLVGKELHAYTIKHGLDSNMEVGNTLIDMYSKCNLVSYMSRAFFAMPEKDAVSWTTVIAGFGQNDCHVEALGIFRDFAKKRIEIIDEMMLGSVLKACSVVKPLLIVKEVHCHVLRKGLVDDNVISNELVDVYGKCKNVDYASRVFDSIKCKDVVSWTSMISCSYRNGEASEAVELFRRMIETGLEPDYVSLLSVLSAAGSLSALYKGRELHCYLLRRGFCIEEAIAVAVVDMYACSGDLQSAKIVFDMVERKGLLQYTSMINAYGMHGSGKASVELFDKMRREENISPDRIAFLAVLYACSHAGLVDEGREFLEMMEREYGLEPWGEHYVCVVDMLGRANRISEAFEFIETMEAAATATAEVWCALLAACRFHSEKEIGEIAAKRLLEIEPTNPGNLVLVSNVFAEQGRWKDVEKVRAKMKEKKRPGCSWIEIERKIHVFTARDKSHPERKEIYEKLREVTRKLEEEGGYVASTEFVVARNVDEREKVEMLYEHSERLAIAYGLLRTPEGACLRITKNLRVCWDCHSFCKLVSKLYRREIVMRDVNRFHRFENGLCSCGDYW